MSAGKGPVLQFFAPERIALDRELASGYHTELEELLSAHSVEEFEIRLAEIARYCDIILHGDYLPEDLDKLCGVLRDKLFAKRCPLILPTTLQ